MVSYFLKRQKMYVGPGQSASLRMTDHDPQRFALKNVVIESAK